MANRLLILGTLFGWLPASSPEKLWPIKPLHLGSPRNGACDRSNCTRRTSTALDL